MQSPLEYEVCRFVPLYTLFSVNKNFTECLLCVRPYLRLTLKGSRVEGEYLVHLHHFLTLQKTGRWHVCSSLPSPSGHGTFSHSPWYSSQSSSAQSCRKPLRALPRGETYGTLLIVIYLRACLEAVVSSSSLHENAWFIAI